MTVFDNHQENNIIVKLVWCVRWMISSRYPCLYTYLPTFYFAPWILHKNDLLFSTHVNNSFREDSGISRVECGKPFFVLSASIGLRPYTKPSTQWKQIYEVIVNLWGSQNCGSWPAGPPAWPMIFVTIFPGSHSFYETRFMMKPYHWQIYV